MTVQFFSSPAFAASVSAAASSVAGILGLTFSTAQRQATTGFSLPSAFATRTALRRISFFVSRSGAMFMAESVSSSRRSKPGTSNSATCDSTFASRRPFSLSRTALRMTAVSTRPFITASASPFFTSETAMRQAAALSGSSMMRYGVRSSACSAAMRRICCSQPTRMASAIPRRRALSTARSTWSSCAQATARRFVPCALAAARSDSMDSIIGTPPLVDKSVSGKFQ